MVSPEVTALLSITRQGAPKSLTREATAAKLTVREYLLIKNQPELIDIGYQEDLVGEKGVRQEETKMKKLMLSKLEESSESNKIKQTRRLKQNQESQLLWTKKLRKR